MKQDMELTKKKPAAVVKNYGEPRNTGASRRRLITMASQGSQNEMAIGILE